MISHHQRTFHLKTVSLVPEQSQSFRDLVVDAVKAFPMAAERQHEKAKQRDRYRVLNNIEERGNDCIAVSIFAFTPDANQNAVDILSDSVTSYPIKILAPTRDSETRQEFIEGLIWLTSIGDYVAFLSNISVHIGTLEEYFSWLITKHIGTTVAVQFADPDKPSLRDYNMKNVKSIVYEGPIEVEDSPVKGRKYHKEKGISWSVIKALVRSLGEEPPDLQAPNTVALSNLRVEVIIKAIERGESAAAMAGIKKIADTFRDIENPPVSFSFKGGKQLRISEMRVTTTKSIKCENGIPDAFLTCKFLEEWLRDQIHELENPKG